jgi:excisionase family DNA binding protein
MPTEAPRARPLHAKAVADLLGLSVKTIRTWCRQGRLNGAYRIGREWFLPAATVNRLAPSASV